MKSILNPPWKSHFPQFAQSTESLVELFCTGQLAEESYLEWASGFYELPVLQDTFFDSADIAQMKSKYPNSEWNQTCFPVVEGDGILYIACIEPQQLLLKQPHCYVLASYSAMSSAWEKTALPVTTQALPVDFSGLSAAPNNPNETIPSHLEVTADIFPLGDELVSSPTTPAATPTSPTSSPKTIPPHLTNPHPVTLVQTAAPVAPDFNNVSFTATKTIHPFPEKTKNFTFVRTVFSDEVILSVPGKITEAKDPQEVLLASFKNLRNYYKKLLWCVRDDQGAVFPIACNDKWAFDEAAWNCAVDFKTPNPFRIAKLTQQSYHGPIAPSVPLETFFKLWNNGKYPDQLTITPVCVEEKPFAYLVGCDKGPHFHHEQSLAAMEQASRELLENFQRLFQEIKAVA